MEQKNTINSLSLQFVCNGGGDSIITRNAAEDVAVKVFLPALEHLLDKYDPGDEIITIDRMVCDIDTAGEKLDKPLAEKIIRELEKQLAEKVDILQSGRKATPVRKRQADILLFYLRNGFMPWFININSRNELNGFLLKLIEDESSRANSSAIFEILRNDGAILRICNDFDEKLFWLFLQFLTGIGQNAVFNTWKEDHNTLAQHNSISAESRLMITHLYKRSLLKSILHNQLSYGQLSAEKINEVFVKTFQLDISVRSTVLVKQVSAVTAKGLLTNEALAETFGNKTTKGSTNSEDEPKAEVIGDEDTMPDNEPVYINNSGLVIVAPYLNMFFKKTGVVDGNQITDTAKAITLLHFMATGNDALAELEVVLPKLLCGVEPGFGIPAPYRLTQGDREAADELLQSVIDNWAILKNTSVEGLRTTFLMREGKLVFKDDTCHLKVQKTSVDVLLEYLPWNISMIKQPWMNRVLTVDWI